MAVSPKCRPLIEGGAASTMVLLSERAFSVRRMTILLKPRSLKMESQEFCLWVVAEPLAVEDARRALKRSVPDLDRYSADHSIEIVAARDWYLQDGTFDLNRVIGGSNEKLANASARGYAESYS
jgi:DcmR-like sensory protein